jgi:uncharacterized protein YjbJ (UPF0337 family)
MSDNTSTLNSYIDSAKGLAQSTLASVTGNSADQAQADHTKTKADAEYDASQTVGKVGPLNVTPGGGVSTDSSDRSAGQWDQTVGSAKETLGNLIGSEDLKTAGRNQNRSGQGQEAKGQVNDYTSGVADRIHGAVGNVGASLTGDRESQQEYQNLHDDGKSLQRSAEHDINKQANAQGNSDNYP